MRLRYLSSYKKIILAGGSGFIGQHLARHFQQQNDDVVNLTRNPKKGNPHCRNIEWDGKNPGPWQQELNEADVLINLAGYNVNCRYNTDNQRAIIESRRDSVEILGRTLAQLDAPPPLWIQAGSLGIYGDTGDTCCDETSELGLTTGRNLRLESFPVDVCKIWEQAFREQTPPGVRKVMLRISFVLSRDESALRVLANMTRCGFGGTMQPGTQHISWIHIDDLVHLYQWLIDTKTAEGIYNASSPHPVTNRRFMELLRKVLRRPWSPPIPYWAAILGAFILRTEPTLALAGRRCISKRLDDEGFTFQFPELPETLRELYPQKGPQK